MATGHWTSPCSRGPPPASSVRTTSSDAGSVLEPGSSAGILIYENRWAAPLAAALRRGGAHLVARGGIPMDELAASLDAAESA